MLQYGVGMSCLMFHQCAACQHLIHHPQLKYRCRYMEKSRVMAWLVHHFFGFEYMQERNCGSRIGDILSLLFESQIEVVHHFSSW